MNNEQHAAVTGLGSKTLDVSFSPRRRQYTPKMDSTRIKIIIYEHAILVPARKWFLLITVKCKLQRFRVDGLWEMCCSSVVAVR